MRSDYILKAAMVAAIFVSSNAGAQMVGSDIFLRGQYVEVGIGHLGYFGSDANAPSGYHPHGSTKLGFVADPGMTGWSTGSTHYMGDYFIPGFPFEGWALQIGTGECQGYNNGTSTSSLITSGPAATGNNVSYSASGSTVSGTWQGTFDSVDITQVTTLDTNSMYFSVKITLTNTAVAPKNDLYYFRSLDPDNDQTWPGGGFPTDNVINYQMPDTFNASAVTASGMSSTHPPLTLGTTDTASRAVIYNSWPISISSNLADVYSELPSAGGGSYYNVGVNHPGDIAVGLIINIPHLATVDSAADSVLRTTATGTLHPANTASFTYFYAFSAAAVDSAIAHLSSTPVSGSTLGIKNVNNESDIHVYPNPSTNMINVTNLHTGDNLSLYDMMGRAVIQNQLVFNDGASKMNLNNLPAGAYVLLVSDANGSVKSRVPVRKN